jgi:hypothetical protein
VSAHDHASDPPFDWRYSVALFLPCQAIPVQKSTRNHKRLLLGFFYSPESIFSNRFDVWSRQVQ